MAFVPEVSRFYGIAVRIIPGDHNPPHVHAVYAGQDATLRIRDLTLTRGRLPRRAARRLLRWADLHHEALMEAWERVQRGEAPGKIAPLD